MPRSNRLRLQLNDADARQVRQWLAPELEQRRAQRAASRARQQQRQRRTLLLALWVLVFAVLMLSRYL